MAKTHGLAALLFLGAASAGAEPVFPPYPERGMAGTVTLERLPPVEHPVLATGGEIWDEHCRSCHGSGLAGAPKVTGTRFWQPRIDQGLETMFTHAKEGFRGNTGTMPPRGGKPYLTDAEIEAAIRFMIHHSGGAELALEGLPPTD